jgi:hypothetical protein
MIIDIRYSDHNPGLLARKIWEKLFRLTKAENFQSLDSFLCDLKLFEKEIEYDLDRIYESQVSYYWSYDRSNSGWTNIQNYHDGFHYDTYKITITKDTISIEELNK